MPAHQHAELPAKGKLHGLQEILFGSDALYFHEGSLRQILHCECRTCREWFVEELSVNLVHLGEILDVGEHNGSLDHVAEIKAGCAHDFAGVVQRLACLLLDAALNELARCRVQWNLAGCEYESVNFDSLAVWADSCRCFSVLIAFIILVF